MRRSQVVKMKPEAKLRMQSQIVADAATYRRSRAAVLIATPVFGSRDLAVAKIVAAVYQKRQ